MFERCSVIPCSLMIALLHIDHPVCFLITLQVFPFAAEDSERSVLGQGVAYLRDKLGGQLRVIPNDEKPLVQHVRPVKGQFVSSLKYRFIVENICCCSHRTDSSAAARHTLSYK